MIFSNLALSSVGGLSHPNRLYTPMAICPSSRSNWTVKYSPLSQTFSTLLCLVIGFIPFVASKVDHTFRWMSITFNANGK